MDLNTDIERVKQQTGGQNPRNMLALRELFWHNVVREMLTSLSVMAMSRRSEPYDPKAENAFRETFDGRVAVITTQGVRVAIAEVHPVFACSIPGSQAERDLSNAVQCTVFQIRTPTGEVHTLPLHEIRSIHALSDELMNQLQQMAQQQEQQQDIQDGAEPFGFAAFTSLSKDRTPTNQASDAPL